jgi:hypothetical protein
VEEIGNMNYPKATLSYDLVMHNKASPEPPYHIASYKYLDNARFYRNALNNVCDANLHYEIYRFGELVTDEETV